MVASLLRLLHSGFQDARLTSLTPNPDAFAKVFMKAGRFTTQWQPLEFDTQPAFGTTAWCTLQRKSHLLTKLYLVVQMPNIRDVQLAARAAAGANFAGPTFGWTNSLGHALIQSITLEIGGSRVEVLDGRLMELLDEFYTPIERVVSENKMIQRVADGFGPQSIGWDEAQTTVYVPLPFWFSRGDMGSALPVDGIYADSIRVSITFRGAEALYVTDSRVNEVTQFPFQGSPFFRRDPAGKPFPGLIPGDPFAKVSAIPNLSVPAPLVLGNAYLLAEYVTLDKPEANRFRQAEFTYPVIQHYALPAVENQGLPNSEITVRIPNPTRHLFMMTQRSDAVGLNAYFLATRDLKGPSDLIAPWWPNTKGLATEYDEEVVPGFATRDSEPLDSMVLTYEGRFVRVSTENMALYRSILPTYELRKTPLFNRYYYCIPFCLQAGAYGGQTPLGEANLDKIINITLTLNYASLSLVRQIIPAYTTYIWAETYNVLKIYGGRAGLLFGY